MERKKLENHILKLMQAMLGDKVRGSRNRPKLLYSFHKLIICPYDFFQEVKPGSDMEFDVLIIGPLFA
jgi:hypothetical protein